MLLSCYVPSQIIPKSIIVHLADKQILKRHIMSYHKKNCLQKSPGGGGGRVSIPSPWTRDYVPTGRDLSKTQGKKSKKPKAAKQTRMSLSIERSRDPTIPSEGEKGIPRLVVTRWAWVFCSCCFVCVFCCCFGCFLLLFVLWFGCFVLLLLLLFWGVTKSATYHSNIYF